MERVAQALSEAEAALDHLLRSAELGSPLARAELFALSGRWGPARAILAGDAAPEARWSELRGSVDLARWLAPPLSIILSEKPRMAGVQGMVAPDICDWLIARARPKLAPAKVADRKSADVVAGTSERTNSACGFGRRDGDLILAILRSRIADVTKTALRELESTNILRYSVGQEFRPHFDIVLDPDAADYAAKFAAGGQRTLTFLLPLNDDYEGGETDFPALRMRWKGRKGTGLFFWSVTPDGALDRLTYHAGRAPTRGEKWMLSQWIRSRPTEDWMG
jgi:prolyl 4-hydroxylase